jgi:PIN domain nuclease of toxin-antitoxin system
MNSMVTLLSSRTERLYPLYVVDTHALIWYLTGDKRLSPIGRAIFDAAKQHQTRLVISAISIAELYYANKKSQLFPNFAQIYQNLKSESYIEIVNFVADDVLDFDQDSAVPEMHDRIIAGLARRIGAPLLTHDPAIMASGFVQVVW